MVFSNKQYREGSFAFSGAEVAIFYRQIVHKSVYLLKRAKSGSGDTLGVKDVRERPRINWEGLRKAVEGIACSDDTNMHPARAY
jgi:hypothetical protein